MPVDSIAATTLVAPSISSSLLALRFQHENESATVNLVSDAVKQVQETNASSDRQNRERLLDIVV